MVPARPRLRAPGCREGAGGQRAPRTPTARGQGAQPGAAPAVAPQRRGKRVPAKGEREGETGGAALWRESRGEAGVKSRISMRAGLMQITAIGSSRRKAKQLPPALPSSALQPGEA